MNRTNAHAAARYVRSHSGRVSMLCSLLAVAGLALPLQAQPAAKEGEMKRPSAAATEPRPSPATPPAKAPAASSAPAVSPTPDVTPEALQRLTADSLERVALFNLRVVETPSKQDYAAAAMLLGVAQSFAPDDTMLLRRQLEAAWSAGDADLLNQLTQRVVQVDPTNLVAQLRLISNRLSQYQTTDERLARMEAFLGAKGASLDPSVRSRLALDAALLYRERGDETRFIEKLRQATQLDSTNKDAALLALTFYSSRRADPMGRLEMMANLLYADPVDPNSHYSISTHLASLGAFDQARRFHRVYQAIVNADGVQVNFRMSIESLMLDWRCEGVKSPSTYVRKRLYDERNMAARTAREERVNAVPGALSNSLNAPHPEDIRLDLLFEQVRLATATILADEAEMRQSANDLAATVKERTETLQVPAARGNDWTDETAAEQIRFLHLELNLWRLITNVNVDQVDADAAQFLKDVPATNAKLVAIDAWRALRSGDAAKALAIAAGPCDDPTEPVLRLCKGEAMAALKQTSEAIATLDELSFTDPFSTVCTYAMDRSAQIAGAARKPGDFTTPLARDAAAYARKIPTWIDSMISSPQLVQLITIEAPPPRISALDRSTLTLRIRNVCPIPLALGSDKPINTRFLFHPVVEAASLSGVTPGQSEVFEFDRRFRLNPQEEMTVVVKPDAGLTGYLAQIGSGGPTRVRYRVLQGFKANDKGAGCVEINTPTTAREPLLESRLSSEELVDRLDKATDVNIAAVLTGTCATIMNTDATSSISLNARGELARKLVEKYPSWSLTSRMLCAAMMPPASQVDDLRPLDAAMKSDPDASVRLVALLTRVAAPDDAMLASAAQDTDNRLVAAAALQSDRLKADQPTYAKVGTAPMIKSKSPSGLIPTK